MSRPTHLPPFQRFLDEQRDVVWRYLVGMVGATDADDVFQETFMSALRAYDALRPGSNLRAWVLTVAHHKALDHFKARARRAIPVEELPDAGAEDRAPGEDPIWERVRALPDKQRAAVTLRFAGGLTHAEVALAMGTSEEAARRSAHEGIKKLREELVA